MTQLPGSGYLSDNARTEGEMKTALEQLHDVVAEIGSEAPTLLTISTGALDPPLSSMILVRSEGFSDDTADILLTIATTNITQGRVVILKNNDGTSTESGGQTITITHGTSAGSITMTDGSSFILCAERILVIIYSGDHWIEVWRSYGRANSEDAEAERLSLGLGTASVEAIATASASSGSKVLKVDSSNLSTDDVLKINVSGNIVAATTGDLGGGDAITLDGNAAAAFVRTDDASAQSIIANLSATTSGATRITANTSGVSQTAGFVLQDGGIERALLYLDTADGDVYLSTKNAGGASQAAIRIDAATSKLEFNSDVGGGVATWESLRPGAGNGLDADLLDGNHVAAFVMLAEFVAGFSVGTRTGMGGDGQDNIGAFKFSGMLIQWGWAEAIQSSNSTPVSETYTYPEAYAAPPFVIMPGEAYDSSSGSLQPRNWLGYDAAPAIKSAGYSTTATVLTVTARGSGSGNSSQRTNIYAHPWIAIGEPAA
jgi:hypothetical protein